MYKAIVFDFFGVIENDQYSVWLNKHGFDRQGEFLDVSIAADKDLIGMPDFYRTLSKLSGIDYKDIEAEFEENQTVDEVVVDIINKLHSKYKTALASNSNSNYLDEILSRSRLESLFDYVIISGDVGYSKPSAEFFEYLLDKLDLSPSEIIFIDDTEQNVLSAQDAGIKSLQFTGAISLKQDLEKLGVS